MSSSAPIGFFDSGVGGLCIRDAVMKALPRESTVYIADSAYCPYGNRPAAEIRARARLLSERLLKKGCKAIVVACNTATAAAIDGLRARRPDVPFIGIEPAVKPAALHSKTGVVGVLATHGTFDGRLYRETCARFAADTTVLAVTADEFVTFVERGETDSPRVEKIVRKHLEPLLAAGADYIVLGCTHFPVLRPVMERVLAGRAAVIDPADAVARRVKSVLAASGLLAPADAVPTHLFSRTKRRNAS